MGETNIELAQIFNSYLYHGKKMCYRSFHRFTLFKARANEINFRAKNL